MIKKIKETKISQNFLWQKKSCNLSGQKKSGNLLGQKNQATSKDKKNDGTSQDKFIVEACPPRSYVKGVGKKGRLKILNALNPKSEDLGG